jgi:hypothetical protein
LTSQTPALSTDSPPEGPPRKGRFFFKNRNRTDAHRSMPGTGTTSKRDKRPKSAVDQEPARPYQGGTWKPAFLAYLRKHPNVSRAAKAAGIERKTAYKAREHSAKFGEEWDEAYDEAIAEIERVAFENASSGSAQYQTMMIFLLKNWMPERYKDVVQNEHTGKDGGDVVVKVLRGVSVDDL